MFQTQISLKIGFSIRPPQPDRLHGPDPPSASADRPSSPCHTSVDPFLLSLKCQHKIYQSAAGVNTQNISELIRDTASRWGGVGRHKTLTAVAYLANSSFLTKVTLHR
jgi:hypothetical protein